MIPWICSDNREQILNFIETSSMDVVCGHFELNNYEVMRGINFNGGESDKFLNSFDMVLSGHFHIKSNQKNVFYLGTQYELSFADVGDTKGFHVYDTEIKDLTFIENQNKMFHVLYYSKIKNTEDFEFLKNKYVKLMVDESEQRKYIDLIIEKIESVGPFDLTVAENYIVDQNTVNVDVDLSKDTLTIINEEIDSLEETIDKHDLKTLSKELYMEAFDI